MLLSHGRARVRDQKAEVCFSDCLMFKVAVRSAEAGTLGRRRHGDVVNAVETGKRRAMSGRLVEE